MKPSISVAAALKKASRRCAAEVERRKELVDPPSERVFLYIYGLQRYRMLRQGDGGGGGGGFSFSLDEGVKESKVSQMKLLGNILRDGPAVGVHAIIWSDSALGTERCFDRSLMREFEHRFLFQMNANDSSNLIDSAEAGNLGQNRAIYYSEELGVIEKCLPYKPVTGEFMEMLQASYS